VATRRAFLSEEWVEAARAIYARHAGSAEPAAASVRINLVIENVPFGEGTMLAHLDTSTGFADIDLGHLADPELIVHLDYQLARTVLVEGDAQAGFEAFMAGRVRMEGDVTKLLTYQQASPSPRQLAIAAEIRAITD
jgi:hypothetical protein